MVLPKIKNRTRCVGKWSICFRMLTETHAFGLLQFQINNIMQTRLSGLELHNLKKFTYNMQLLW